MQTQIVIAQEVTTTLQNLVLAVNNLNQTIASVFPIGTAVTASAGAASGNYLTILAPDGNSYKIDLLDLV